MPARSIRLEIHISFPRQIRIWESVFFSDSNVELREFLLPWLSSYFCFCWSCSCPILSTPCARSLVLLWLPSIEKSTGSKILRQCAWKNISFTDGVFLRASDSTVYLFKNLYYLFIRLLFIESICDICTYEYKHRSFRSLNGNTGNVFGL